MASKKVENARKFLWDDDEDKNAKARASTNLSGSRFSTRDYAVDQSVNLMAMGEQPTNLSAGATSAQTKGKSFSQSVAGLFHANTEIDPHTPPKFDEYGDAAASAESEEYISDKTRRTSPVWSSFMNCLNSCVDSCAITCGHIGRKGQMMCVLAILGTVLLFGGIYLALSGTPKNETEMQDFIVSSGMTPESVFRAIGKTPQKQALKWIISEDPAKLEKTDPAVLDRYALAVFYYSSNAESDGWKNMDNWMTGTGHCAWHGVECVPRQQDVPNEPLTKSYDANEQIISLIMPGNGIEGRLPVEFGKLEKIITLDLQNNDMSGEIPTTLSRMPTLRNLLLRKNSFVGTFPSSLTELSNLHELHLGENHLDGPLPSELNSMKELRSLALSQNLFTGSLPDIKSLTNLVHLYVDDNDLGGTVPDWIQSLTALKDLRLSKNKFTGPFSKKLKEIKTLEILHLNDNQFEGTIPDVFDSIYKVHDLQLQNNKFSGEIPNTVSHLQGLKKLYLDHNELIGIIPHNIGILDDVKAISLNNNKLTGEIPTFFGNLDDIVHLSLNDNSLEGSIPTELGGCFRLKTLHLDSNKLAGDIPVELGKLNSLESLQLEENEFSGISMPPEICELVTSDELAHLSADCKSKVACTCCHQCI